MLDIHHTIRKRLHRNHDQEALVAVALSEAVDILINLCKCAVIQIQRAAVASALPKRLRDEFEILSRAGHPTVKLHFMIEHVISLTVLFHKIQCFIRFHVAFFKCCPIGTQAHSGRQIRAAQLDIIFFCLSKFNENVFDTCMDLILRIIRKKQQQL